MVLHTMLDASPTPGTRTIDVLMSLSQGFPGSHGKEPFYYGFSVKRREIRGVRVQKSFKKQSPG